MTEGFSLYGNPLRQADARKAADWQRMFKRKFRYDPDEKYDLSLVDNEYLGPIFGLRNIVRNGGGDPISVDSGVVVGTVRMGFGHYRIAMAGASAARAMGFTPLWLDLLSIPGITSEVVNWWNTRYSRFSRLSQRSKFFNKHVWEAVTTGNETLPGISWALNNFAAGWPWRFLKANARDYRMSELFGPLHGFLPADIPMLTAHMWNCMGAVAGGMTNVVDMMFDNWPMAFQLTEGAKHGVQSPSAYYGFRTMNGFDEDDRVLKTVPSEDLHYVGHHVDHELVENIEGDCRSRLERMHDAQPRRFLLTMGGAGAQRELFKAIIEHTLPMVERNEIAMFVNLGDHADNWKWLKKQLGAQGRLAQLHTTWEDTRSLADEIRTGPVTGLHVFLHDNIYHAVYSTNYIMRVVDVLITKPSELAFYPVPKILNERVGGHEAWGAIRAAELGDGTIEVGSIPRILQAIDLLVRDHDLLEMYCNSIVRNKSIGIYDGAYRCVALATGRNWMREAALPEA